MSAVHAALAELVRLKDIKEKLEANDAGRLPLRADVWASMKGDYADNKTKAWDAARTALAAVPECGLTETINRGAERPQALTPAAAGAESTATPTTIAPSEGPTPRTDAFEESLTAVVEDKSIPAELAIVRALSRTLIHARQLERELAVAMRERNDALAAQVREGMKAPVSATRRIDPSGGPHISPCEKCPSPPFCSDEKLCRYAVSTIQPSDDERVLMVRNAMAGRALGWEKQEGIHNGATIADELRHWIDRLDEAMTPLSAIGNSK